MSIEEITWKNPHFKNLAIALLVLFSGYHYWYLPSKIAQDQERMRQNPTSYRRAMDSLIMYNQSYMMQELKRHTQEIESLQEGRKRDTAKLDRIIELLEK